MAEEKHGISCNPGCELIPNTNRTVCWDVHLPSHISDGKLPKSCGCRSRMSAQTSTNDQPIHMSATAFRTHTPKCTMVTHMFLAKMPMGIHQCMLPPDSPQLRSVSALRHGPDAAHKGDVCPCLVLVTSISNTLATHCLSWPGASNKNTL